jgi:hypothetical protein
MQLRADEGDVMQPATVLGPQGAQVLATGRNPAGAATVAALGRHAGTIGCWTASADWTLLANKVGSFSMGETDDKRLPARKQSP